MPQGSLTLTTGVTTKTEGMCVQTCGVVHQQLPLPSAAVGITQHGPVVMAIANGQMMQKWVHLVMNVCSADGCLTRAHFYNHSQHRTPEGLHITWSTLQPTCRRFLIFTGICFNSSYCKVTVCVFHQFKVVNTRRRSWWIKTRQNRQGFGVWMQVTSISHPLSSCPLSTAVLSAWITQTSQRG